MKLTPIQRRQRLLELMEADPDCRRLLADYRAAQRRFTTMTDRLPRVLREWLWALPGTGYYLHHRVLDLVSRQMCFPEELQDS